MSQVGILHSDPGKCDVPITETNPLPVTFTFKANEAIQYELMNVDDSGAVVYLCKQKNDGTWLFVEIDESSDNAFRYANESNNSAYPDYATAFTDRTTLTYELLEELTGL